MKVRMVVICAACAVLVAAAAGFLSRRYMTRPFFANNFRVFGHGILANWEPEMGLSLNDSLHAYHDYRECVLLVVPIEPGGDIDWVIDTQPVGDYLRIRRQRDGVVRVIEWRRDCLIWLDDAGEPNYTSLSVREFEEALSAPSTIKESLNELVARLKPASRE